MRYLPSGLSRCVLIFALINSPVFAAKPVEENLFAVPSQMPAGPFKGQPIDGSRYQPAMLVPDTEANRTLFHFNPETEIAIANFHYRESFYVLILPKNPFKEVYFQRASLSQIVPLFHGQFRFDFKDGVVGRLLKPNATGIAHEEVYKDVGIVFGLFGIRAKGEPAKFNPVSALQGKYAVSFTVEPLQRTLDWVKKDNILMKQFKLGFEDSDDLQKLLETGLMHSKEVLFTEPYDLLFTNCISEGCKVLDRFLGLRYAEDRQDLIDSVWVRHALIRRRALALGYYDLGVQAAPFMHEESQFGIVRPKGMMQFCKQVLRGLTEVPFSIR